MARRTYAQIFLDKLAELSGDEYMLIGNKTLRDELDWDDDFYDRIKYQLESEGLILLGKGKGGSVALANAPGSEGLSLFISYSNADRGLKDDLVKHLRPLERQNLVETWHDGEIGPGDEWETEITEQLEAADIILLRVSVDFINSKFCYDIELERALERHQDGEAVVIPVILRQCVWQQTPFAILQALPTEAKPITLWADRDEAFTNVAEGIRAKAEELLT